MPAIIVALAPLLAPASTATFVPPLDVPVRQVQSETRDDGRNRRVFRLERTFRFSREANGYRVAIAILSADAEADEAERARYRTANRGMVGRTIVVHLDRAGALRSVEDLDTVWQAWSSGLVAAQAGDKGGAADATLRKLAAFNADQRAALLGAIVTASIADATDRSAAPDRPVTLASPPPFGQLTLAGTASAAAIGDRIVTRTTAVGATPVGNARVSVTNVRTADPVTGLLTSTLNRTVISTPSGVLTVESSQILTW